MTFSRYIINTFFSLKSNILYVTENSSQPSCLRILVQLEDKEEGKKKDKGGDHTSSSFNR